MRCSSIKMFFIMIISLKIFITGSSIEDDLYSIKDIIIHKGLGKINSTEIPLISIDNAKDQKTLFNKLKLKFKNKLTIILEQSEFGELIILTPIKSEQCSQCKAPTINNITSIMEQTYTISIFKEGGLIIGAPTGKLLNALGMSQDHSKIMFKSDFTKELNTLVTPLSHAEYIFNKSYTQQFVGSSNITIATLSGNLHKLLSDNNYLVSEKSTSDKRINKNMRSIWKKENSVIYLTMVKINENNTQVQIYETISK